MPSSYTANYLLEKQANGENDGTWGTRLNSLIDMLDESMGGQATVAFTSVAATLALSNGTTGENGRHAALSLTATAGSTGTATLVVPNIEKFWYMKNDTTSPVAIRTAPATAFTLPSKCDA